MFPFGVRIGAVAVPVTRHAMIWLLAVGVPVSSGSSAATTNPAVELSAVFAGTGVATALPSEVWMCDTVPLAAIVPPSTVTGSEGQEEIVPAAGLGTDEICAVTKLPG